MRIRLRRTTAIALALAAVSFSTAAAASPPDPYAAPAALPALAPDHLDTRYAATRASISQALTTARRMDDSAKARALSGLLRPGRTFLSFDARGRGEAVEVIGDLRTATRIAIVVPGADNTLTDYDSWKFAGGGARSLYDNAPRGSRLAVIAWLGYRAPAMLSTAALTTGRADEATPALRALVADLHRIVPSAHLGLLCHSYGTVVCARAVHGLPIDELALYGSPGVAARDVAALHTRATVWAGRKSTDWIAWVPHIRLFDVGFGIDPVTPRFGARIFDAGHGTHSEYLKPGTKSLAQLTHIALGQNQEVAP